MDQSEVLKFEEVAQQQFTRWSWPRWSSRALDSHVLPGPLQWLVGQIAAPDDEHGRFVQVVKKWGRFVGVESVLPAVLPPCIGDPGSATRAAYIIGTHAPLYEACALGKAYYRLAGFPRCPVGEGAGREVRGVLGIMGLGRLHGEWAIQKIVDFNDAARYSYEAIGPALAHSWANQAKSWRNMA